MRLHSGYFTSEPFNVWGVLAPMHVAGIGTFVFALFAGLFVGAIFLGHFADRYGRRTAFTFSLIPYSITTAIMAFQQSGFGVDLWRGIAALAGAARPAGRGGASRRAYRGAGGRRSGRGSAPPGPPLADEAHADF